MHFSAVQNGILPCKRYEDFSPVATLSVIPPVRKQHVILRHLSNLSWEIVSTLRTAELKLKKISLVMTAALSKHCAAIDTFLFWFRDFSTARTIKMQATSKDS